jgi:hypothetical protein
LAEINVYYSKKKRVIPDNGEDSTSNFGTQSKKLRSQDAEEEVQEQE